MVSDASAILVAMTHLRVKGGAGSKICGMGGGADKEDCYGCVTEPLFFHLHRQTCNLPSPSLMLTLLCISDGSAPYTGRMMSSGTPGPRLCMR